MDEPVPPFVPAKYSKGGRNPGPRTPRPATPPPPSGLPSWVRPEHPQPRSDAHLPDRPRL
jgi:hypothetical protein